MALIPNVRVVGGLGAITQVYSNPEKLGCFKRLATKMMKSGFRV
jgi:hypothetical protein